jgi:hypothetical protein
MSALPPKADIRSVPAHVRFVPIADSCTAVLVHIKPACRHHTAVSQKSDQLFRESRPIRPLNPEIKREVERGCVSLLS